MKFIMVSVKGNKKIAVAVVFIFFIAFLCIRKNKPELKLEVTDIKMDCSKTPSTIDYVFSEQESNDLWWKAIRSKKGRVQCGNHYLDFNAVATDGNKLAYVDIVFKQKKTRLTEIPLSDKAGSLLHFETFDKFLSWEEEQGFFWHRCIFYYENGRLYCEKI